MPHATTNLRAEPDGPKLGLVCITFGPEIRYRTITRKRFLSLSEPDRAAALQALYADNLATLFRAIGFCRDNGIRLYRVTSQLFPMNDDPVGGRVLDALAPQMAGFAKAAGSADVRVVLHPDPFVVLSSLSPAVVRQSIGILERHALIFDRLGLPRSAWAAMNIHGGKAGRADALVEAIDALPGGVRSRLTLENDEYAYGAAEILAVCRRTGVPLMFDPHHHVIKEKLAGYDDPGIAEMTAAARNTWPRPDWQVCHMSNGLEFFADPRHSELIDLMPAAFADVPWIEIEAKGKEAAIRRLAASWPPLAGRPGRTSRTSRTSRTGRPRRPHAPA